MCAMVVSLICGAHGGCATPKRTPPSAVKRPQTSVTHSAWCATGSRNICGAHGLVRHSCVYSLWCTRAVCATDVSIFLGQHFMCTCVTTHPPPTLHFPLLLPP